MVLNQINELPLFTSYMEPFFTNLKFKIKIDGNYNGIEII